MEVAKGVSDARVAVGLDFGTTFSGFAYAHKGDPAKVFTFYEWPDHASGGGKPYCKTQTSLYYSEDFKNELNLESWVWPALVNYRKALSNWKQVPAPDVKIGKLVTKFKLHLASSQNGPLSAEALPNGLTARIVITDFLLEMSKFIMADLKNRFGSQLAIKDVQWCLNVELRTQFP